MPISKRPERGPASVHDDLFDQPGHLLRRAHQIAQGVFNELVGPSMTPVQFAILRFVHESPGIDQVGLARQVGLDTSSTALTAARMETRGLLRRDPSESDKRQLKLHLTSEGEALLGSTVQGVHAMRDKLLSPLDPEDREHFMELLRKFVDVNNDRSRAPMRRHGPSDPA